MPWGSWGGEHRQLWPSCPAPAESDPSSGRGTEPLLVLRADSAPAEGNLLLLCCNMSHKTFMTYQLKPKAGGRLAQSDFGCGTGATLAIPRVSVPPLGPTRCLGTSAEWDLFIGHPAPCKTCFIGKQKESYVLLYIATCEFLGRS